MYIGFFDEFWKPHLAASFSEVQANLKFSAALVALVFRIEGWGGGGVPVVVGQRGG